MYGCVYVWVCACMGFGFLICSCVYVCMGFLNECVYVCTVL